MKHPLLWLLANSVIAFCVTGFIYLGTVTSTSAFTPEGARTPALVSGIVCLCIATGLLVLGIVVFRKKDEKDPDPK